MGLGEPKGLSLQSTICYQVAIKLGKITVCVIGFLNI